MGDPGIPRFVAFGRMLTGLLLGVSMMVLDRGMGWEVSLRVLCVGGVAGGVLSRIWVGGVVLGGGLACFWWCVN